MKSTGTSHTVVPETSESTAEEGEETHETEETKMSPKSSQSSSVKSTESTETNLPVVPVTSKSAIEESVEHHAASKIGMSPTIPESSPIEFTKTSHEMSELTTEESEETSKAEETKSSTTSAESSSVELTETSQFVKLQTLELPTEEADEHHIASNTVTFSTIPKSSSVEPTGMSHIVVPVTETSELLTEEAEEHQTTPKIGMSATGPESSSVEATKTNPSVPPESSTEEIEEYHTALETEISRISQESSSMRSTGTSHTVVLETSELTESLTIPESTPLESTKTSHPEMAKLTTEESGETPETQETHELETSPESSSVESSETSHSVGPKTSELQTEGGEKHHAVPKTGILTTSPESSSAEPNETNSSIGPQTSEPSSEEVEKHQTLINTRMPPTISNTVVSKTSELGAQGEETKLPLTTLESSSVEFTKTSYYVRPQTSESSTEEIVESIGTSLSELPFIKTSASTVTEVIPEWSSMKPSESHSVGPELSEPPIEEGEELHAAPETKISSATLKSSSVKYTNHSFGPGTEEPSQSHTTSQTAMSPGIKTESIESTEILEATEEKNGAMFHFSGNVRSTLCEECPTYMEETKIYSATPKSSSVKYTNHSFGPGTEEPSQSHTTSQTAMSPGIKTESIESTEIIEATEEKNGAMFHFSENVQSTLCEECLTYMEESLSEHSTKSIVEKEGTEMIGKTPSGSTALPKGETSPFNVTGPVEISQVTSEMTEFRESETKSSEQTGKLQEAPTVVGEMHVSGINNSAEEKIGGSTTEEITTVEAEETANITQSSSHVSLKFTEEINNGINQTETEVMMSVSSHMTPKISNLTAGVAIIEEKGETTPTFQNSQSVSSHMALETSEPGESGNTEKDIEETSKETTVLSSGPISGAENIHTFGEAMSSGIAHSITSGHKEETTEQAELTSLITVKIDLKNVSYLTTFMSSKYKESTEQVDGSFHVTEKSSVIEENNTNPEVSSSHQTEENKEPSNIETTSLSEREEAIVEENNASTQPETELESSTVVHSFSHKEKEQITQSEFEYATGGAREFDTHPLNKTRHSTEIHTSSYAEKGQTISNKTGHSTITHPTEYHKTTKEGKPEDFLRTLTELPGTHLTVTPQGSISIESTKEMFLVPEEKVVPPEENVMETASENDAICHLVPHSEETTHSAFTFKPQTSVRPTSATKTVVVIVNNSGKKIEKINETALQKLLNKSMSQMDLEYIDIFNISKEPESNTNKSGGTEMQDTVRLKGDGKVCVQSQFDSNNACVCDVDNYLKSIEGVLGDNLKVDVKHYNCNRLLGFHDGLIINSDSKPVERQKRSLLYLSKTDKSSNVVENESIDDVFSNDYDMQVSDSNLVVLHGAKVQMYCHNKVDALLSNEGVKYSWEFKGDASKDSEVLSTNENPLIIHSMELKNSGNYTCTKTGAGNNNESYDHELEVVTFPIYKVKTTIYYEVNDTCSLSTGDLLYSYVPKIIGPILCGGSGKLCKVDMDRPRCFTKDEDNFFNVTIIATMNDISSIFSDLDESKCSSINCKLKAYSHMVGLVNKNAEIVKNLPVISRISPNLEFLTNVTFSGGKTEISKPPRIITSCRSGYGLEKFKQRICVVCPKHTFSGDDEAFCRKCPAGQYQPQPGSKACLACSSPVDDAMCLRMLYSDTKLFKIYVGVAFGLVLVLILIIIFWNSNAKKYQRRPSEGTFKHHRTMRKRNRSDVENQALEPLLRKNANKKNEPPEVPPPDF
ncbi:hypothetical protein JTB14_026396 [Gonioctena quinquepunctata]|nr:hypothetical protein JTB14_026396 [Gonioctena quinquepunctata]